MSRSWSSHTGYYVIAVAVWLLSACAHTSVISPPKAFVTVTKLNAARVVWIDNEKLHYHIMSRYQSTFSDREMLHSRFVLSGLIDRFRKSAPALIQTQLSASGVPYGNAAIVELYPVEAVFNIDRDGRICGVRILVKDGAGTSILWSMTIQVFGQSDQDVVDELVKAVASELKKAGWL